MKVRTRVAVLAAYVSVAGAMLAFDPSPAIAEGEGCYSSWQECLEVISHCGGIGTCEAGSLWCDWSVLWYANCLSEG